MPHWNEKFKCLVDYQGIPLSRSQVESLVRQAAEHLKNTPEQLAAAASAIAAKAFPKGSGNVSSDADDYR